MLAGGRVSALRGSSASVHTFDPVVETFPVKSGFVRTFERYPVPDHSAGIKGIPKNPLNRSAFHEIAAFAGHRRIQSTLLYIHLSARDLSHRFGCTVASLHAARLTALQYRGLSP